MCVVAYHEAVCIIHARSHLKLCHVSLSEEKLGNPKKQATREDQITNVCVRVHAHV